MLKINKSILIICMISLFLIIGQISASDTDLIEINDTDTSYDSIELNEVNADFDSLENDFNEELNYPVSDDYQASTELKEIDDSIETKNSNEIGETEDYIENHKNIEETRTIETKTPSELNETDHFIEIIEKEDTCNIVRSNDDYSCGAASLATVLNNLGIKIGLDEAKNMANTTSNGTTMEGIVNAAKEYNLEAYGVNANASNLKENFIVHMKIGAAEHWSVVKEIVDNKVILMDPNIGPVEYDLREFEKHYTKNAIIISKRSQINNLDMSQYVPISKDKIKIISGKGVAYSYSKQLSYINNKVNPGYAFQIRIVVPKWGGNTVRITTKKITSHKICCNVVYKVTYYKKPNYKGKGTTINYPCIFNLAMPKGKTVTVNLPTPNIQSFRFTCNVCKFP